jgi:hypothetical protein
MDDSAALIRGSSSGARVRFPIAGAHALAVHGRPRSTADLDVFVDPTLDAARLARARERLASAQLAPQTTDARRERPRLERRR